MVKVLAVLVAALVAWGSKAQADEHGHWLRLETIKPICHVWDANPAVNVKVTWSGACANGKAQGRGVLIWRSLLLQENKTTGEMKDGRFDGHVVFVRWNGERYEGEYKDGKRHGRGIYMWPNGDRFEGDWKGGKKQGRGVTVWSGGRYEGNYRNDKAHGYGNGRPFGLAALFRHCGYARCICVAYEKTSISWTCVEGHGQLLVRIWRSFAPRYRHTRVLRPALIAWHEPL